MINVYYDLHIHSALSPCANDDMTPDDIAGMALLNGLDLIAVTDHNSFANTEAVIEAAKSVQTQPGKELIVLPGIEVSTAEEVHVLCLFSNLESAIGFEAELSPFFSSLKNRINIFGNQYIFNKKSRIIGEMERMLLAPASLSFDSLYYLTQKHNGAFIPSHVDRNSFSVLSNLGFLPPHLNIGTVEVSLNGVENGFDKINAGQFADNKIIFSSDAHQLWSISERDHFLLLPERTADAAIDFLR